MFAKLAAGPHANPFKLRPTKRDGKPVTKGIQGDYRLTWQKRELPDAGAMSYSFETYGLPAYARYGFGNINVTKPLQETFPASYVFQSVGMVGNPPAGILQGQFVTQPLMDPNAARAQGIIAGGSNVINSGSPVLSP